MWCDVMRWRGVEWRGVVRHGTARHDTTRHDILLIYINLIMPACDYILRQWPAPVVPEASRVVIKSLNQRD